MEPLHPLLESRYSPRAFADRALDKATIRSLLEAARWAPSSFNEQPWRFLVATKEDTEAFERMHACLRPGNQDWAGTASVLMISVASMAFTRNDKPNRHAFHDVGLAVSQLIAQASHLGLHVRQMAGFDVEKTRETYSVPEGFEPVAAIAIGYAAEVASSSRSRKPMDEIAFTGTWGEPY